MGRTAQEDKMNVKRIKKLLEKPKAMNPLFFLALLFTPLGASALDLLQFAQKYQGLYPSEIVNKAAFEQQYVVRTKLDKVQWSTEFSYDDGQGITTINVSSVLTGLGSLALVDRCKATGRGVGVTGFGVKVPFTRQTCSRVFIRGYDKFFLGEREGIHTSLTFRIPLSANDFRRLKAAGNIEIAVALTTSMPDGVVVDHSVSGESATRDFPYETRMNVYYLHGKVSEIQYFLPWAKTPFATQQVN